MIDGVELKQLTTYPDERGYFREVIRVTDNFFSKFGQWSHSYMHAGVVKAWHIHQKQTDWWYVLSGTLKAVVYDLREDSPTYEKLDEFLFGDNQPAVVLRIPPGVAHGCKALTRCHLVYMTSHTYDPDDEGRLAHDSFDYDWLAGPVIK